VWVDDGIEMAEMLVKENTVTFLVGILVFGIYPTEDESK